MLVRLAIFVAVATALALAAPALGQTCTPSTSAALVDTGAAEPVTGTRYYFTWDCYFLFCQTDNMGSPWLYEEANGIDGWQRGDEVVDDTCGGMIPADRIIF